MLPFPHIWIRFDEYHEPVFAIITQSDILVKAMPFFNVENFQKTYSYDALDRIREICYNDSDGVTQSYLYTYTGDRMDGTTYDAIGNPLTYNGYTMTWEGRQLLHMYNGFTNVQFAYNENGFRIKKSAWGIGIENRAVATRNGPVFDFISQRQMASGKRQTVIAHPGS